ncbi:hypothetical protein V9T40_012037 [Parthenolecanium corni]|uniref:Coiled-coil domain-containing protein n=1 Tax=Parthenolecanium corni TaxID=536013 RepID=A0AAN9TME2_9HEMI
MPKKFAGENSKAAVARARKDAVRKDQQQKKQQEIEDAYWRDDDKHVTKKLQRKEDKEKKRQEQLEKKQTNKILLESELSSIKSAKPEPTKITRMQIISNIENDKSIKPESKSIPVVTEPPLIENLNRLQIDGEEARTVDEALDLLSSKEKAVDLHPERRLKAAFAAFEANNMERLKKEYPTLRLSQIKQMLRKEWMKSPENPLNNL